MFRRLQWSFWAWAHDLFGAVECTAESIRRRAVRGMSDSIDWGRE